MLIGIINIGMGNLGSVMSHTKQLGFRTNIIENIEDYDNTNPDVLLLPGVGAYTEAMNRLERLGLDNQILEHVNSGKSIIGICLGFQLMFEEGVEGGKQRGLGLLPGKCQHLKDLFDSDDIHIPEIPQIGFKQTSLPSRLKCEYLGLYFYYMHCYCIAYDAAIHNTEEYGISMINNKKYVTSVSKPNISGFQFHPEKSQKAGSYLMNLVINLEEQ